MEPIAVIAFLGIAIGVAIVLAVVFFGMAERAEANRAVRAVTWDEPAVVEVRRRELAVPVSQRIFFPALKGVSDRIARFAPSSVVERLDREVVYAGGTTSWDGERLLAVKTVAAIGLPILVFLTTALRGAQFVTVVLSSAIAAALGYYIPEWILRYRSGKRQQQIQRALPDALDLLSITVEAGLGFDAAVNRVAREIRGPLGGEMYRMVQEMRLGKSRSDALRDLGDRSNIDELRSFVLAMVQAEIFGISIAKVLHVQAEELRGKRRQRAEEQAQKLPVKILFPLLFGIFPALFVVLLGPALLQISDNVLNRDAAAATGSLQDDPD